MFLLYHVFFSFRWVVVQYIINFSFYLSNKIIFLPIVKLRSTNQYFKRKRRQEERRQGGNHLKSTRNRTETTTTTTLSTQNTKNNTKDDKTNTITRQLQQWTRHLSKLWW